MGLLNNLFKIFGGKDNTDMVIVTASDLPTIPVISATHWDPYISVPPQVASGIVILKPSPLIIPFTNNLDYLDPRMREDMPDFMTKVKKAGLNIGISCTARLMKCQVALYAQGRQPYADILQLRKLAGMEPITLPQSKKIVTWTLVSKHLVNYDDTDPNNDYSQAFDFFLLNGKQASWDVKANVNKNSLPDYEEVGYIATKYFGWVWGGNWKKNPDAPHIELGA